jgi:cytidylate kinase
MKAIAEIRKTDRALAQRLLQNAKRERKVQNRKLSAKEGLMMNMDVGERASIIAKHPNPRGYLREMQRKGIATPKVVELVRMKLSQ